MQAIRRPSIKPLYVCATQSGSAVIHLGDENQLHIRGETKQKDGVTSKSRWFKKKRLTT